MPDLQVGSNLGPNLGPRVVSLGGGHGLAASLSALKHLTANLTAVVTVADNGGSSGRLRSELGTLPPGDLRMALTALCSDNEWGRTWADVLQHRFTSGGGLHDHAVGNLLIVALWDLLGDHVGGLDLVGRLLGAQGRVLPMSAVPLDIEADVRMFDAPEKLTCVRGQAEVASVEGGDVVSVRLEPADPPACPEAIEAIDAAEWVVIGPGSWFTSVIPNLLVPGIRTALHRTSARRILVLNLGEQVGETAGFSPADHLDVIAAHAPELGIDYVLADTSALDAEGNLEAAAKALGAELVTAKVASAPGAKTHDSVRLTAALRQIIESA